MDLYLQQLRAGAYSKKSSYRRKRDAAGHTSAYAGLTFTYNAAGRMSSSTNGSTTTSYVYNALGQRVRKSTGIGSTVFVYDELGHLIGEYDGTGAAIQEIVWLRDTPVATIRQEACGLSIFYIHTDHLNTPRRITRRSTSDVVWSWDGDPFGTATPNENPAGLGIFSFNLRFPGQYYDNETGLNGNGFRNFDPTTGRYIQSDPSGLNGGINSYAYAFGNPLSRSDRLGLAPEREELPPETTEAAEADPLADIEYHSLMEQIREYERDFEDPTYRAPGSKPTHEDVTRLQDILQDLKNESVCPAPKEFRDFRRKPGSLGRFKGRDALQAENAQARDAANIVGLDADQIKKLHAAISGRLLTFQEIVKVATDIKNGKD